MWKVADKQGQEGKREENKEGKNYQAVDCYGTEAIAWRSGRYDEYGLCRRHEATSCYSR